MAGHKKEDKPLKIVYPAPWDVRTARHKTGFTMQEAADLVYVTRKTWFAWECNPDHVLHKKMHPAYAELFALKTGLTTPEKLCPILKKLTPSD